MMQNTRNGKSSPKRLIVFTRCPEVGRCKTRLIPAMGERAATAIHEWLVRRTMSWMQSAIDEELTVEVQYAGDDLESLKLLCGGVADRVSFRPQRGGDLGQRLSYASASAFQDGAARVAIIGTDCPQLGTHLIFRAFALLADKDLVVGPATDGGYYLIASRAYHPDLFVDIDWGSGNVLEDTLKRASNSRLTIELLEALADVDRPTDVGSFLPKDVSINVGEFHASERPSLRT